MEQLVKASAPLNEGARRTARAWLEKMLGMHPTMASQIADACRFAEKLPIGLLVPQVWTDGESEVVFEWISGQRHALVGFEGDGIFGYAMRQGDKFESGSFPGSPIDGPPADIIEYLI